MQRGLIGLVLFVAVGLGAASSARPAPQGPLDQTDSARSSEVAEQRVTVFSEQARVERTVRIALSSPEARVVLADLPPTALAETVRVECDSAAVLHVDVGKTREPLPRQAEARELLSQIDRVLDDIRALDDEERILRAELSLVETLRRAEMRSAAQRRQAAQTKLRELERRRTAAAADLERVQEMARRKALKARVFVRCRGNRTVLLTYRVPQATWRVTYRAMIDPATKRANVDATAVVQQGSGEDWRDVHLAVSGADLDRENSPPTIDKMIVTAHKPHQVRRVLARRFEHREHFETAAKESGGVPALDGTPPQTGIVQLEVEAKSKVTVPSDGREVIVTLDSRSTNADVGLEAVPKLFPYVYERATLVNPFPFAMPPGSMAVHRGNAYVGNARVQQRAPGEPFSVVLGVPHELQAERYVKIEQHERPGAVGGSHKITHKYEIHVGNWSASPQKVRIIENVPVALESDISVRLTDDTTPRSTTNARDGILSWDIVLPPRSKKVITLGYTVTLPARYEVYGY